MAAGPHRADRYLARDAVQVVPVGHPVDIGKQVLVPAAAYEPGVSPAGVCGQEIPHTVQHGGQAAGVLCKLGHPQQIAVFHQVHMAVVEAAADKAPAQVGEGVAGPAQSQGLGVRPGKDKAPVLHNKSLGQVRPAGVDRAVIIDRFHAAPPACHWAAPDSCRTKAKMERTASKMAARASMSPSCMTEAGASMS